MSTSGLPGTQGFTFGIAADLDVLQNPTDKDIAMDAMWKTSFELGVQRSMPWMSITNDSSFGDISEVRISVGDASKYNFASVPMFETTDDNITVQIVEPSGGGTDELVLRFTNFGWGDTVYFKAQLAADDPDGFPWPDYREVMTNLAGDGPESQVDVTVVDPADPTNTDTSVDLSLTLDDFTSTGPMIIAPDFRRYSDMDAINVDLRSVVIPEPGAGVLLLAAAAMLACCVRRKRVRT